MTAPLLLLKVLVYVALAVAVIAPVVICVLAFKDWRRGKLW